MKTLDQSPTGFHEGERAVQERAGVRGMAERVGASIHSEMLPAARDFLARQPMVIVGYADAASRQWASILVGAPGFARALNPDTVALDVKPTVGDPLEDAWQTGTPVGLLAIELSTRRRMRVNGQLTRTASGRMTVDVREAYANCPKYIQVRELAPLAAPHLVAANPVHGDELTESQAAWVAGTDTFFIATAHQVAGADVSHRGGAPGFVHVNSAKTLTFPDYAGNNMFNTLGNLAVNPNAGLLFVDFESGDTLQITGEARVVWDADRAAEFAGADRIVEFTIAEVIYTPQPLPFRWRYVAASPFNPV